MGFKGSAEQLWMFPAEIHNSLPSLLFFHAKLLILRDKSLALIFFLLAGIFVLISTLSVGIFVGITTERALNGQ